MTEKNYFEEEVFSKEHRFTFKSDPSIISSILKYKNDGKVLDIGCGEAGNSLILASKGFEVSCIDISKSAIDAVKKQAEKLNLKINFICGDIEKTDIKEDYDIIIMTGVLHFLDNADEFIEKIKNKTKKLGINIIDVFLEESESQNGSKCRFFKKGEIPLKYADWIILEKESYNENENFYEFLICRK